MCAKDEKWNVKTVALIQQKYVPVLCETLMVDLQTFNLHATIEYRRF